MKEALHKNNEHLMHDSNYVKFYNGKQICGDKIRKVVVFGEAGVGLRRGMRETSRMLFLYLFLIIIFDVDNF